MNRTHYQKENLSFIKSMLVYSVEISVYNLGSCEDSVKKTMGLQFLMQGMKKIEPRIEEDPSEICFWKFCFDFWKNDLLFRITPKSTCWGKGTPISNIKASIPWREKWWLPWPFFTRRKCFSKVLAKERFIFKITWTIFVFSTSIFRKLNGVTSKKFWFLCKSWEINFCKFWQ